MQAKRFWSAVRNSLFVLSLLGLSGRLLAEKPPKTYPEQGKITGTGLDRIRMSHTYKIETAERIYEFDCWSAGSFGRTGSECGGDKKLQIGDVIHFRLNKGKAYIPVPVSISPDGEQQLHVTNEELKSH